MTALLIAFCALVPAVESAGSGRAQKSFAVWSWSETGDMLAARADHTATLLADGRVLVVGGHDAEVPLNSAECYDPASSVWSAAGVLAAARRAHTATLLADGRVLVAGGLAGDASLASAELYDPATNAWSPVGAMAEPRAFHGAALLADGSVLVMGGRSGEALLSSAEMFDPASGVWSAAAPMKQERAGHGVAALPNGWVFVAGGHPTISVAEFYDPAYQKWYYTGGRGRHFPGRAEATLLDNGRVFVSAAYSYDLYDPATESWVNEWGSYELLSSLHEGHRVGLMGDSRVLVTGGWVWEGTPPHFSEKYLSQVGMVDPGTGWQLSGEDMPGPRGYHTVTRLLDGRVLVAGGTAWFNTLRSAAIYVPYELPYWSALPFVTLLGYE